MKRKNTKTPKKDISELIPSTSTDGSGWVAFHKSLKPILGKKDANDYWARYWQKSQ